MADALVLFLANPGVTAGSSATPTGGSWGSGSYSFLVVPRYHPHDSTVCGDDCGIATLALDVETYVPTYTYAGAFNNVTVAANDKVELTFTPPNRNVRAYEVYYIAAASITAASKCTRLTNNSVVYNSNGTITITINASTANTTTRTVSILAKDGDTNQYTIPGDCRYSFPEGAAFEVAGASTNNGSQQTTGTPTLTSSGLNTVITSTTDLSDSTGNGTISYEIGELTYFTPVLSDYIVLEPVINMSYGGRTLHQRDYRGAFTSVAYANKTNIDAVDIDLHFTSWANLADFNHFTRWVQDCQEIVMYDQGAADLTMIAAMVGKFDALSVRPIAGKSTANRFVYTFNVTEEWRRDGV